MAYLNFNSIMDILDKHPRKNKVKVYKKGIELKAYRAGTTGGGWSLTQVDSRTFSTAGVVTMEVGGREILRWYERKPHVAVPMHDQPYWYSHRGINNDTGITLFQKKFGYDHPLFVYVYGKQWLAQDIGVNRHRPRWGFDDRGNRYEIYDPNGRPFPDIFESKEVRDVPHGQFCDNLWEACADAARKFVYGKLPSQMKPKSLELREHISMPMPFPERDLIVDKLMMFDQKHINYEMILWLINMWASVKEHPALYECHPERYPLQKKRKTIDAVGKLLANPLDLSTKHLSIEHTKELYQLVKRALFNASLPTLEPYKDTHGPR